MWPFSENKPKPVETTPSQTFLEHEERILKLELQMRALHVEMESFTDEVSRAAKRAYKRHADSVKEQEAQSQQAPSSASRRRLELKRQLRNRAQGG